MANTYVALYYHLVFSTKDRIAYLTPQIEQRVWSYLGGVAKKHGVFPQQIGGCDDHIHALVSVPASLSISQIVQCLKGDSSRWIHETFPELKEFAWQQGYGAFTVSKSLLPAVTQYILEQRLHHAHGDFQDEFRALLAKHGVEFDERYLWG